MDFDNQTEITEFEILPDGYEEGMDFDDLEGSEEDANETNEQKENDNIEETDADTAEPSDGSEEEDSEEDEVEDEESEEETPTLDDIDIKFLHETKKLKDFSREDIKTNLQKGLNYDRLQAKHDEFTNEIQEIADMYGLETEKLIDNLKEQYFKHKAGQENRNINDVRKEFNDGRKTKLDKTIEQFVKAYPDINVDELPDSVMEATKAGKELVDSYTTYLKDKEIQSKDAEIQGLNDKIAQLEKQIKVSKQNETTKKKGIVKKTSGSENAQTDDFLEGLFGN